jgi:Fe-S-cluster containining protein
VPECKCKKCVSACRSQPGWFLPGEAEKAAELLGMPFEELRAKYLIREYWMADQTIYVWAPRKVGVDVNRDTAGWSSAFQAAPCIFLTDQNLCMIHAAKPAECREAMPCDASFKASPNMRESIKEEWEKIGNPLKR